MLFRYEVCLWNRNRWIRSLEMLGTNSFQIVEASRVWRRRGWSADQARLETGTTSNISVALKCNVKTILLGATFVNMYSNSETVYQKIAPVPPLNCTVLMVPPSHKPLPKGKRTIAHKQMSSQSFIKKKQPSKLISYINCTVSSHDSAHRSTAVDLWAYFYHLFLPCRSLDPRLILCYTRATPVDQK